MKFDITGRIKQAGIALVAFLIVIGIGCAVLFGILYIACIAINKGKQIQQNRDAAVSNIVAQLPEQFMVSPANLVNGQVEVTPEQLATVGRYRFLHSSSLTGPWEPSGFSLTCDWQTTVEVRYALARMHALENPTNVCWWFGVEREP